MIKERQVGHGTTLPTYIAIFIMITNAEFIHYSIL